VHQNRQVETFQQLKREWEAGLLGPVVYSGFRLRTLTREVLFENQDIVRNRVIPGDSHDVCSQHRRSLHIKHAELLTARSAFARPVTPKALARSGLGFAVFSPKTPL